MDALALAAAIVAILCFLIAAAAPTRAQAPVLVPVGLAFLTASLILQFVHLSSRVHG